MVLIRKRKVYTTAIQFRGSRKRKVVNSRHFGLKVDKTHDVQSSASSSDSAGRSIPSLICTDDISDQDLKDDKLSSVRSRYEMKKSSCLQDWQEIRNVLYDTYINSEAPVCLNCQDCGETSQLYRCVDCMPYENVCESCLQNRHQYPHLHIFEAFRAFVGAVIETPTWIMRVHNCDTTYLKEIIIVDEKGRQHTRQLQFCKCEAEAITLVRYRLWPSSTRFPKLAFHMELLKWLNGLLIECHVSVKGFCEALKARCSKHHRSYTNLQIKDIYKVLINETFPEFRHFFHRLEQPFNLTSCEKLDNGTECPACFSTVPKIYSFDADFQLVRKSSSGKQWEQPKHKDIFFLDQSLVDKFITDYDADKKKPIVDCSEFQAGSIVRSKNKNKKLSETAVFGSTCRHEYPKYFFSLKHGERLGYFVYLLNKLLEEQADDTYPIYVMYDIACSLHSHMKKHAGASVLDKVKFSIPIFHSYGHKMDCQVLYGPRRTSGIGLTDGESLERLWSYLGKFSSITKEMTPENRVDLLTDALLHYGRKIRDKLGASLAGKFKKASMLENSSRNSLQELLDPLTGISHEDVTKWIDEEKETITCSASDKNVPLTSHEQYSLKLDSLHKMGETHGVEEDAKYKKVTATVQKMERKLKIKWKKSDDAFKTNLSTAKDKIRMSILIKLQRNIAEGHFLLDLIKKYARGQAIAIRLCRQLKKIVAKIKQSLKEYNEIGCPNMRENLPLILSFDDVKCHDSAVWQELDMQNDSEIPSTVKRQAIHLRSMIDRAVEEQNLVKQEMASVIQWYKNQHFLLKVALDNSVSKGSRSCLIKEGLYIESKLGEIVKSFSLYSEEVDVPSTFFDIVGLANQNEISFEQEDIVSDFEVSNEIDLDDEDLHDLEFDDGLPLDDELDLIEDDSSLEVNTP